MSDRGSLELALENRKKERKIDNWLFSNVWFSESGMQNCFNE
jgi:hypothetical protein